MRKLLLLFSAHRAGAIRGARRDPAIVCRRVRNMTCELCPRIDFAGKTVTVTFEANRTNTATLIKPTTDAGYAASVPH